MTPPTKCITPLLPPGPCAEVGRCACAGVDNLHSKTTLQKAQEAVQATAAAVADNASQAYQCAPQPPSTLDRPSQTSRHVQHCMRSLPSHTRLPASRRKIQQAVQESNLPQRMAHHTAAARDTAAAKVSDLSQQVRTAVPYPP